MIAGLPYDAEVEYLESTGTQYIDAGIVGSESLILDATWEYGSPYAGAVPFGSRISATSRALAITGLSATIDSRMYLNYGTASNWLQITTIQLYGHKWSIHVENGACALFCDGDAVARNNRIQSPFSTASSLYMFAAWMNGTIESQSNVRIFGWDVQDAYSSKIRSLVPVRFTNENGQSEGAMYDRVSRKLFRNAGTGAFTIGPDVATPVMGLHVFKSPAIAS